jgi:hypothetical protein
MAGGTPLFSAQQAHPVLVHLGQLEVAFAHPRIDRPQPCLPLMHCTTGEIFRVAFHTLPPNIRLSATPRASR